MSVQSVLLHFTCLTIMLTAISAIPQRKIVLNDKPGVECREPSDLNQLLLQWHQESSKLDVEPSAFVDSVDEVVTQPAKDSAPICGVPPSTEPASTVMERSLCPWSYRSSYDEQREPKTLTEAYCQCRKSRGNSGSYCLPIRRQVPVLKRKRCDARRGVFEYERSVHWVTVGCHSVLPRSQRAAPLRQFMRINDDNVEV